ncbi:MAG: ribosome rescue protein RqcH [Candidatus Bathyarchaeota archaeon]|nr:ribosome rescue protein RqcH [Candidatus Bathyarchaeota archaeon]
MKEQMSSFDIAAVAAELNEAIRGSRITKIYQINTKILLLNLRNPKGENLQLLIEVGKRTHLTSYNFEKPKKPPAFCMALRKYLENGVVREITQYDFERIIEFIIERGGQSYRFIIEMFDDGNVILVDHENRILHALAYRRMRDRNVLRGEVFRYPPQRGINLKDVSLDYLGKVRDFGQLEVVKGLTRLLGIGGFYAEELLLASGVDKSKACSLLSEEELNAIFRSVKDLMLRIERGNYEPCIFISGEGVWVDVAPFPLRKYSDLHIQRVETFNKALDEYYAKFSVESKAKQVEDAAKREIASLEKILESQKRSLEELRDKADAYRRIGDTIYSHLYEVDSLLNRVMAEKKAGRSWEEITKILLEEKRNLISPSIYFASLKPETLTLQISIGGQIIDLNLKMSAQQNASKYYEMAKKSESKIDGLEEAIKQTMAKIEEAKIKAYKRIEEISRPPSLKRRKEWFEKFRWFFSSEGFLVIGGRDAVSNEVLIRKYMEDQDIVFHADIAGSPFTIVKTKGRMPTEITINEAAQFTASYSRAWREKISAVDVYWVKPEQVSKSPPSGEYLPRGSFMIYGAKNYVRNVPLEVSIGVRDDELKVIGGPTSAIAKQTNCYVKIFPGDVPSGKLAKEIRRALAEMAPPEKREEILKIPLEDIQAFIPLGLGKMVEAVDKQKIKSS